METAAAVAASLAQAKQRKPKKKLKQITKTKLTANAASAAAGAGAGKHAATPPAQTPSSGAMEAFDDGQRLYQEYKKTLQNKADILEEAIRACEKAAKLKHPDAPHQLGMMYKKSFLSHQNSKLNAFKIFEKEAKTGHIKATIEHAICYIEGIGVEPNLPKAQKILQSISNGNVKEREEIQFQLFRCEIEHFFISGNFKDFDDYFQQRGDELYKYYAQHPEAALLLYQVFYHGYGEDKDRLIAYTFLDKAILLDYAPAYTEKAKIFEAVGDWKGAVEAYEQAKTGGDMFAAVKLGICYLLGRGIKQNQVEALKLFETAKLNGYVYAELGLAIYQLETSVVTSTNYGQKDEKETHETNVLLQQGLNKLAPFLKQNDVEANLALIRYYAKKGLTKETLEYLNKQIDVHKDKELFDLLQKMLNKQHTQLLQQLQNQLQKTQTDLIDKTEMTADAKKHAAGMLAIQTKLAEQEKQHTQQLQQLQEQLQKTQKALTDKKTEMTTDAEKHAAGMLAIQTKLAEQEEQHTQQFQQLQEQLQKSERALLDKKTEMTADAEKHAADMLAIQAKLAEQEEQNNDLKTENQSKTADCKRKANERQSAVSKLQSLKKEMKKQSLKASTTIKAMEDTIQKLTKENDALRGLQQQTTIQKRGIEHKILKLEMEVNRLKREEITRQNENMKNKSDLKSLSGKLTLAQTVIKSHIESIDGFAAELTAVRQQQKSHDATKASNEAELEALRQKLSATVQQEQSKTQQMQKDYCTHINHLEKKIIEEQQATRKLHEDSVVSQGMISNLLAEIQQLKTQLTQQQSLQFSEQNKRWNAEITRITTDFQKKQITISEENSKMQKQYADKISALEKQIHELKIKCEKDKKEHEQELLQKSSDWNARLTRLRGDIKTAPPLIPAAQPQIPLTAPILQQPLYAQSSQLAYPATAPAAEPQLYFVTHQPQVPLAAAPQPIYPVTAPVAQLPVFFVVPQPPVPIPAPPPILYSSAGQRNKVAQLVNRQHFPLPPAASLPNQLKKP